MERSCDEWSRKGMILERILYCASSALISAVATFSLTKFLQRRRRHSKQKLVEEKWALQRDDAVNEKDRQLLIAVARSKELEREFAGLSEDKEAAEDACQDLEERLSDATEANKNLKNELAKTKYAHKKIEDSFEGLLAEKETALDKVQSLKRQMSDAQKSENECRNSYTGLQRTLTNQVSDRKALEKQAKKLSNELSEVKASRVRLESHYKNAIQKLEEKLKAADAEKQKAQSDLSNNISKASATRQKLQAFGGDYLKMESNLQDYKERLQEVSMRHKNEFQAHAETSQGLKKASERIRELEKELKITREAARNQLRRTTSSLSFESNSSQQLNLR